MNDSPEILVTLSTFSADSPEPKRLLERSGFNYAINTFGRRMKPSEVEGRGRDCLGLIAGVEEYRAETLAKLPKLKCISRCGVGLDNIDLKAAEKLGITILNTPDEPTIAVAESTLGMILALLRKLPLVDTLTHRRRWQRVTGNLLAGKTVGVIGLGRIGRRVAELLLAFDARVLAVDPLADTEWVAGRNIELSDFFSVLEIADIVTIHAASTPQNPLHIGAAELALMKPGGWIVNMARGDIVDDVALLEALSDGRLSGAALDVFPTEPYVGPLCDSERVILSPHQATLTTETRTAMEVRAVDNLISYLRSVS